MSASPSPFAAAWRERLNRAVQQLPERLRVWLRGLTIVVTAAGGAAAIYVALLGALALLPVAQVWLGKLIVDHLVGSTAVEPDVSGALLLAVLYVVVLAVPEILEPVQRVQIAWLEDRATAAVDDRLMAAGTRRVDLVDIERPAFQDHARLAQEAARRLMRAFTLLQGLSGLFTVAGVSILLLQLHPLLPVILLAAMVPHLWAEERLSGERWSALQARSRAAREGDYCARVTLAPAAAKEVRVFGLGDFFLQRFDTRFAVALSELRRIRWAALRLLVAFSGLHALALAGGFWYVVTQAGAGKLTLGDIALYLGAVVQVERTLMTLPVWFGQLSDLLLHLRALFAVLDRAGPRIAVPVPGEGRPAPTSLEQGVALQQVGFRYPESTQAVLADMSLVLPAGEVTALVGANGAGKSTLVKLLTRMYDPDTGTILLDGAPLDEYDLAAWRRRIAVVYQDFAQFALTLHENIAVGAYATPAGAGGHIEQAAQWAGADEIAAQLPQGYDTQLTRQFAGGVELSGGEWQKVALARGFVRDAALVILDEPTAALDAEAEYRLFAQFRALVRGKTALIISHRFSTVRMADHIVVLDEGRVIEAGSHAALVAQGGRYASLYEMQAGRYR